MILRDGESVQEHIRKLTELFEELAVIDDPMKEEDQVVNLLASLPESFNVLVTALETNTDVPKMEVVTERLLHDKKSRKTKKAVLLVRPCLCLARRRDYGAFIVERLDISGEIVVS